jgi:peptide/nickel transport system substrate-binding protein
VRVRRALNVAIDRAALVRRVGGPFGARATCQFIPLGFAGHRPYCPYRRDLARARRLVAASGTRGASVAIWTDRSALPLTRPIVAVLRALGYRASARVVGADQPWINALPDDVVVQAAQEAWVADYPGESTMIVPFRCAARPANLPSFCDRRIERASRRALALQAHDPRSASGAWAAIDRLLVDRAAAVPLVNPLRLDFLSERAGNYQYHPLWGILLDQLWVR